MGWLLMNETLITLQPDRTGSFEFSQELIDTYLQNKSKHGVSDVSVAKYKAPLKELLLWVKTDHTVTAARLQEWRADLEVYGYSKITIQKKVTVINDFLRSIGQQNLCIPKPQRNNLKGKVFGYLTVLELTNKKYRRDHVWKCLCKCGKEIEVPATSLVCGNTTSCGCLNTEILQHTNRYVEGTSLRQALDDKTVNPNSLSGFVGVQPKRDKWTAYITYKGVHYNLGTYSKLEDAVKARARAKETVMEDAARLYDEYDDLYGETPRRPAPPVKIIPDDQPVKSAPMARRSDNTSGCTGVTRSKGKWIASICMKGYRYKLGAYDNLDDAVAVRKQAEKFVETGDLERLKKISTNYR